MRRRNVIPRRALAFVALSCLILAACTKEKAPVDSAAAIDTSAPAPVASTARIRQTTGLPGALPKALDSLTGDELYKFTRALTFGGGAGKERACKGSPLCNSGVRPARTEVRVDAVDGQDSLNAVNVPVDGVVAVRVLNQGPFTEKYYGMKSGKNLEFFLVVLPGNKETGRWRLEQLDTTSGARQHSQVATGTFTQCKHPPMKNAVRADFRSCTDAAAASDSVSRSNLVLQGGDNDPIWVTCSGRCCTSTSP